MTPISSNSEIAAFASQCRSLRADGKANEEIIQILKDRGASRIVTVGAFYVAFGTRLAEGKALIGLSNAWHDEKWEQVLDEVVDEIEREQKS